MSIEAMKQALEALECINEGANTQGPHTGISWRDVSAKTEPAIFALRAAIAEASMQRLTDVQQEMVLGANTGAITALPTHDYVKESRQLLEDAASIGFVSVVIFGFKDRQVHIKHSSMVNELELFGALEAAKMQLWGRGE